MSEILGSSWSISQKGLEIITDNNQIKDKSKILQNALNSDLKDIGLGVLNKKSSKISNVVLQIQKIRNVSAPKANEESQAAPRMLKLTLTDGEHYIQALEIDLISFISRDKTPPGTKLLIKDASIESGFLLLDGKSISLLGGRVEHLYEKWETSKLVHLSQKNRRQSSVADGAGPPLWVNFGSKINRILDETDFKSLDSNKSSNKENTEFEQQRQEAIAEASSGAIKKVFGGSVKQIVAPRPNTNQQRNKKFSKGSNKNSLSIKEIDEKPQKPSEKVSLFAFLQDKLPVEAPKPKYQPQQPYVAPVQNNFTPKKVTNIPEKINNLVNKMDKVNLNSNNVNNNNLQYANRGFRQNFNTPQNNNVRNVPSQSQDQWQVGQECMAKYWEDGKFYNANITAITDNTCVVKFKGYGNIEEVLKVDCLPVKEQHEKNYGKRQFYNSKGPGNRFSRR